MSSFGKLTPQGDAPAAGWPTAGAPPHPMSSASMPSAPGLPPIDVPASLYVFLLTGERIAASVSLKRGDVVVTDRRVLIEKRDLELFDSRVAARAHYAVRLGAVANVGLAQATNTVRQVTGAFLLLVGVLAALLGGSRQMVDPSIVGVGILVAVIGLIAILSAKTMALLVDKGSNSAVGIRVDRSERARAKAFFGQAAPVLAS